MKKEYKRKYRELSARTREKISREIKPNEGTHPTVNEKLLVER